MESDFGAIIFDALYQNNYWKVVETILPIPRMAEEGQKKGLSQNNPLQEYEFSSITSKRTDHILVMVHDVD